MIAELKRLHSPDIWDLGNFSPQDESNFCFFLQAIIGPKDFDGGESFDILVCTPKWIHQECLEKGIVSGRHRLIVNEYNISSITSYIEKICEMASGDNWTEIAKYIGRFGSWEFEDYEKMPK